jgi:CheY-like chemotaxis protein
MTKKVLIAEDYDDVRQMMKILIETNGYEAIEATNGFEAVEKTHMYEPDMILMDLSMPVLDGIKATEAIRHFDNASSNIPILALTAYDDFYKEKALEAGCDAVIRKPLEFDHLKTTIDRYLNAQPKARSHKNGH